MSRRVILSDMMRIIAGQWRGRHLVGPPGDQTRPILDRAKAVLFDVLGARLAEPGRLPPVAVLDLFCGTGTLGLEALSRGATFCRFVERHRATAAVLRHNLDDLKVISEAEVMETDATGCELAPPPGGDHPERFELVFVDPPYRMLPADGPVPAIRRLLDRLATSPAIADRALIVVRHAAGRHGSAAFGSEALFEPEHEAQPQSRRQARRELAKVGERPLPLHGPSLEPLVELECREVGNMVFRFMTRPVASLADHTSATEPAGGPP